MPAGMQRTRARARAQTTTRTQWSLATLVPRKIPRLNSGRIDPRLAKSQTSFQHPPALARTGDISARTSRSKSHGCRVSILSPSLSLPLALSRVLLRARVNRARPVLRHSARGGQRTSRPRRPSALVAARWFGTGRSRSIERARGPPSAPPPSRTRPIFFLLFFSPTPEGFAAREHVTRGAWAWPRASVGIFAAASLSHASGVADEGFDCFSLPSVSLCPLPAF